MNNENYPNNTENEPNSYEPTSYEPDNHYPISTPLNTNGGYSSSNNSNNYSSNVVEMKGDMTVKDWLITYLVLSIPCFGLIMAIVWAAGNDDKPSRKTYCIATLIVVIVTIVAIFIFWGALFALFVQLVKYAM